MGWMAREAAMEKYGVTDKWITKKVVEEKVAEKLMPMGSELTAGVDITKSNMHVNVEDIERELKEEKGPQ